MSKSKWGGKRPNSGRKIKGDKPKVRVTITLDSTLIERLDELEMSRSLAIEKILFYYFGRKL
jgi:hypothetical protein